MKKILVNGGKKLEGRVEVSGSKNAALPILFATILTGDINRIENIKVLDTHKDEFKALSVSVKDYRFVMFELGRIFRLIDRMEGVSSIGDVMKRLKDDEELEYIYDNIPYATEMLDKYVINRFSTDYGGFENQKSELYNACPEAFPQFKSAGNNDSRKGTKHKGDIN